MTISACARMLGCTRSQVQYQIKKGMISVTHGKLDPEQVQASYGVMLQTRRSIKDESDTGKRSAKARLARAVANLRLFTDKYERLSERYVDREEAIHVAAHEADVLFTELLLAPAAYAPILAKTLRIDQPLAREILDAFTEAMVIEIGDFKAEGVLATEIA